MKGIVALNTKGLSILFLIVALLVMVTIGYVLSYLIPTQQKAIALNIHSSQAFYVAQSGVEYAIRYALDQGWTTPSTLIGLNGPAVNQRNLGRGRFTISYDSLSDRLTSTGQIQGLGERRITVSNFSSFVSAGLTLVAPLPCWTNPRTEARLYVMNTSASPVTLIAFSASWNEPPVRTLTSLRIDGNQKFAGIYSSGSGTRPFTPPGNSQLLNPNQSVSITLDWNQNIHPFCSVVLTFSDSIGKSYTFALDPEGDGLPSCGG
jgi:hypothetical protein